jgi:flagellar M-ring protein FliF
MDRLREAFGRLSNQQRVLLMVALAAIIALIVGTVLSSRQPEYKVLFSGISERDGGAIITALEQMNVPYKFAEHGGAIMVPTEKVHELRLRLASQGLPKGAGVGFEVMENQKFGISQFAEQVNYQRALEGELAHTIQSIASVQSARVHMAIPKPSVFVREEQKPTASVLLTLYPGRTLDRQQVEGISHLVASSVPQLPLSNVSVIDQDGNVLSKLKNPLEEAGMDPSQLKYVQEIEKQITQRIERILSPVVGEGNVKVQVAADIDFSQTEQTAEIYKPNGSPTDASIRSQQTAESVNANQGGAQGVPGALSNQPPAPATAPITTPATAGQANNQAGKTAGTGQVSVAGVNAPVSTLGQPLGTRKDTTTNYEVDKTIRHTKQAIGTIRRLSAAVVVNHRMETGKDGKAVPKPLSETEMKQLNDLVQQAMGFSQDRGDTVSVANAPFTIVEKVDNTPPLWKDPENIAFAKEIFKYLMITGMIAFLLLGVVRPIVRTMFPPPVEAKPEDEAAAEGAEGEDTENSFDEVGPDGEIIHHEIDENGEDHVTIDHYAIKVQKARDVAAADPQVVANVIKDWLGLNG